jgi:hypothetical protein
MDDLIPLFDPDKEEVLKPCTLLMMSCSATKLKRGPEARPIPASRLYNGPLWQTLRTYIPDELNVREHNTTICVLSGKHGFGSAHSYIGDYEARLTEQKADYLIERGIYAPNDRFGAIKPNRIRGSSAYVEAGAGWQLRSYAYNPYARVIMVGAGPYMRVFESFLAGFKEADLVAADAVVLRAKGGIGEQRSQLGTWLREAA